MTNDQRRAIINDAKSKGYQGSYVDLFKQAALNPSQQDMAVASSPDQKREGLRPMHEAGRTDASMAFKDVPPNTPFNTVGMKAPINIKKYDTQGHLVKSYENVPPGLTNLDTGPNYGTVIETPARMQGGGFRVEGSTTMQSSQDENPGFLRPAVTQDFSEDTTVMQDDGQITRDQSFETTRGNRIRGGRTFSITDPQGNVTTQIDKYRNSRMMGLIPPRSTSKIIYPEQGRVRAQRGSVVDYLLPSLEATNPVDFSQQQAESQKKLVNKFERDLAAEKENVQRVRENVIPTAKRIAEGWENLSGEDKRAYENILDYNPAPSGTIPEAKPLDPLRDQMRNRPEGLKEIMPNYNLHLANPTDYGSQRGIYCTTMGCFAYEEAGARQITDSEGRPIRGNETFVRETAEGVTGFEEVPAGERQPGDMTIITGKSRRNYNKPDSPENTVIRPHHTVIYSGEAERPTDLGTMGRTALNMLMGREIPARDYDYNNPGAIKAYSAETGDMHKFQETVRRNELPSDSDRESFRFYRYIGNVPQYTRGLADAIYNQSQADKVAAALQQNANMKAQMGPERPETPDIQRLEGKQAGPIENDIPERDLKDRRKSKQPKEPSKRAQRRARVKAVKADYKSRLQKLKDSQ